MLTVADVANFRQQFSLSQNMAVRIVRHISSRFSIPMVPFLRQLTIKSNRAHEELFEVNQNATVPTVQCTDTAEFLRRICELRGTPLMNCTCIVGVDRGDETLKVSVTVVENNDNGVPRGRGVGYGNFMTSGVRRILVLAASVAAENYDSVMELLEVIEGLDTSLIQFAVDHKMKSELCGVAGGGATHWCTLCEYDNRDNDDPMVGRARVRTFENLRSNNRRYREAMTAYEKSIAAEAADEEEEDAEEEEEEEDDGSSSSSKKKKKKSKKKQKKKKTSSMKKPQQRDFKNCINPPMACFPRKGRVSSMIPPSALHLEINVVSRICNNGLKDESEGGRVARVMKRYIFDKLHLKQFANREEWTGNNCETMTNPKNTAVLKEYVEEEVKSGGSDMTRLWNILDALESFEKLRVACFGKDLHDDAAEHLKAFRQNYLALEDRVSLTAHTLFRHVLPFCRKNGCGLQPYTEQSHESLHRLFRLEHSRKTRSSTEHPQYPDLLRDAILRFNSMNTGEKLKSDDDATAEDKHDSDEDDDEQPPRPPPPTDDDRQPPPPHDAPPGDDDSADDHPPQPKRHHPQARTTRSAVSRKRVVVSRSCCFDANLCAVIE